MVRNLLTSKAVAVILGFLVVPGLIAVRVLATAWDLDDLKHALETEAAYHLHREVRIGSISGNPLTGVVLRDVVVAERGKTMEETPFAAADELRIRYRGRRILNRDVLPLRGIDAIEVTRLRGEISRDAAGAWNFDDLVPKEKKEGPDRFAGTIQIHGGRLHYRDETVRTPRGPLDITPIDVSLLLDFADHTKISVAGAFSGGSEPVGRVSFEGEIGLGQAAYQTFDLAASSLDLPYVMSYLSVPPHILSVSGGSASGEAKLALAPGNVPAWSVRADVRGARMTSPGYLKGEATYDGGLKVIGTSLFFDGGRLSYGTSSATVTGSLLGLGEEGGPLYDLSLTDTGLDPAELLNEWPILPAGYEVSTGGLLTGDLVITGSGSEVVTKGVLSSPGLVAILPQGVQLATDGLEVSGEVGDLERMGGHAGTSETYLSGTTKPLFTPPDWLRVRDTSVSLGGRVSVALDIGAQGLQGVIRLSDGHARFLETEFSSVSAEARISGTGVSLQTVSMVVDGAPLRGSGWVHYGGDALSYGFDGILESYPAERIARYVDVGETIPVGTLSTRFEVTSPEEGSGPPSLVLKGRVEDVAYGGLTVSEAVFAVRTADGGLDVPWLQVVDPKGTLRAAGRLVFAKQKGDHLRLSDTQVVLRSADLAALAAALEPANAQWPAVGGTAAFVGQVSGPVSAPSVYGSLEVHAPVYERWRADRLQVGALSGDLREITVADLKLSRGYSTIVVNGTVRGFLPEGNGSPDPVLDLLVRGDRISIEDALALAGVPDEYDLSGLAYVEATVEGPVSALAADGVIEVRDGSAAGWPVREASVGLSLAAGDLEFRDLRAAIDPGGVTGHGVIHDVLNTRYLEVAWTADELMVDPDQQEWAKRYDLEGGVSLSGTVNGPVEDLEASFYIHTKDLVVAGQPFSRASVEASLSRFSSTGALLVDFGPVVLEGAGGLVRAAGFWDSQSGAINASLDSAGLRFSALSDLLTAWSDDPTGMAPLNRAAETVGGELHGHIDVDGQPGSLYITGTGLRLQQATYRGEALPIVTGTVTWDQFNKRVVAPEFAIIDDTGIVEGRVEAQLDEGGRIQGVVEGRDVPLARYAALFGGDAIASGSGSFHMVVHGDTQAPSVNGSASIRDVIVALPESVHSSIGQTLQYDTLSVQGISLTEGALTVSSVTLGSVQRGLRLDDLRLPFSYREGGFVRDRDVGGRLWLPKQDLSEVSAIQSLLRRWGVTGSVALDVELGGTLARPAFDGYLTVSDARAVYAADSGVAQRLLGGSPMAVSDVNVRLTVAPGRDSELGRVTLERFEGKALGGSFSVSGGISLVGWSPLDARNRFDLAGRIAGVRRRLFAGPNGVMDLREASLSVAYQPETGVNTLRIDQLDVGLGTGRITAGGTVSLDPQNTRAGIGYNPWDVRVDLQAVPVDARELAEFALATIGGNAVDLSYLDVGHGILDGFITVSNSEPRGAPATRGQQPARIGGEIVLHHAELAIPASLPAGGEPALWSIQNEDFVLDNLVLRVGEGVLIPLLNAPLSGKATATGLLRQPSLSGEFSGAAGEVSILGRTWTIDRLGLAFRYGVASSRELEFDAHVDLQAATYVSYRGRKTRVLLSIDGPLGATEIQLSSDPPIPQSELITLIGSGGGEGGGGASAIGDALRSDLSAALGGLVSEQAVKSLIGRIREALGLEEFGLEIGENAELTGFDIEAEVLPNLFVRVRQTNSEDFEKQEIRFGITYKLPGKGRFSLETTNTGKLQASLEASWSL